MVTHVYVVYGHVNVRMFLYMVTYAYTVHSLLCMCIAWSQYCFLGFFFSNFILFYFSFYLPFVSAQDTYTSAIHSF